MSIESPSGNIKLTVEQMLQLEEFQTRLSNLQTEISIHEKNIKGKRVEISNLEKNREYQQGLNDELDKAISEKTDKKEKLQSEIVNLEKELNVSREEEKSIVKSVSAQMSVLEQKEKEINQSVEKYKQDLALLKESQSTHDQEKEELSKKKQLLAEVLSKI